MNPTNRVPMPGGLVCPPLRPEPEPYVFTYSRLKSERRECFWQGYVLGVLCGALCALLVTGGLLYG